MTPAGALRYLALLWSVWGCARGTAAAGRSPLPFPPGFSFGAATAAYQIEGGWDADDKAASIWDVFTHAAGGATGDVACDSYRRWRDDVRLAGRLGLRFYRFSISWSRLLPGAGAGAGAGAGSGGAVSAAGRRYYDALIDALLAAGVRPLVTLYHWDLPQALQDQGGWLNASVSDWFAGYALTAFSLFGDRVQSWVTLNEPLFFCNTGYQLGVMAPGLADPTGEYRCAKNAMLAHAKAWRLYDTHFRPKYGGQVSIANHAVWYEPLAPGHETLAHLAQQHTLGLYSHPIYSKEGGWPPEVESALAFGNQTGHLLPEFSEAEKKLVQGTYDYYALNFYTSRLVRPARPTDSILNSAFYGSSYLKLVYEMDPTWNRSNVEWFALNPPGLRKQLNWIKDQYDNPEILITENGFPSDKGLDDEARIEAIHTHLVQVVLALADGARVAGYTYWSLLDNLEWHLGYGKKFGLAEVDFSVPERTRTMRRSGEYYRDLIRAQTRSSSAASEPNHLYLLTLFLTLAYYSAITL